MKTPRWLLPFTHGVDMLAIDYVVRLAESAGTMLVPVSLVSAPPNKGARLGGSFFSWLCRRWSKQDAAWQAEDAPVVEEPLWIRTEQHHLG